MQWRGTSGGSWKTFHWIMFGTFWMFIHVNELSIQIKNKQAKKQIFLVY